MYIIKEEKNILTIKMPDTAIADFATAKDPDESHLDLQCLASILGNLHITQFRLKVLFYLQM